MKEVDHSYTMVMREKTPSRHRMLKVSFSLKTVKENRTIRLYRIARFFRLCETLNAWTTKEEGLPAVQVFAENMHSGESETAASLHLLHPHRLGWVYYAKFRFPL